MSLLGKLNESPNIYEFDLDGFFPNVNLLYMKKRMEEMEIPTSISNRLYKINQSIVLLQEEDKVDENLVRKVVYNTDGTLNPNLPTYLVEKLTDPATSEETLNDLLVNQGYTEKIEIGVPQGASTSCGLATLNLKELFEKNDGLVMYADDGICFPNNSEEIPDCNAKLAGVTQSLEKSSWVKVDGEFKKSLKFLGLEFIPKGITPLDNGKKMNHDRLRSFTRSGSRLEFSSELQFLG